MKDMWQCCTFLSLVFISISSIHSQILYQCNFDATNENCFTTTITLTASAGFIGTTPPNGALSDVSSSLKSTQNGENCTLPYKVNANTWDMYFCNKNICPTPSDSESRCRDGKYGNVLLLNNDKKIYQLKTDTGGINGINEQCLFYYYYMANVSEKIINVRKEETDGSSEIIDSVTSSPFNGWILRTVPFNAQATNYKIFFEIQRTSGTQSPNIGFDEISIVEGSCGSTSVTPSSSSTTTSAIVQTTTIASTPTTITTTTTEQTTEQTTAITSAPIETTATTSITESSTTKTLPTTTSDGRETDDNNKILTIILATVIPAVFIVSIVIVIWIKKASIVNCCTHTTVQSSSNSEARNVFKMNRVVPV